MSFLKPDPPVIPPPIEPASPPPVMNPQGNKPAPKRAQSSFLGAGALPPPPTGGAQQGKTLLGQ